jgi:hypothetical protein
MAAAPDDACHEKPHRSGWGVAHPPTATMNEPTAEPLEKFPPQIRVTGKHPTPAGYSYALGSSAISNCLRGIPMFDNFSMSFSARTPILDAGTITELPLFRLAYTNYPVYQPSNVNSLYRGGERWALEVLCTPYAHRGFIQTLCIERALPMLREWLCNEDKLPKDRRRMSQTCWYRMPGGELAWEEDAEQPEPDDMG